MKKMKLLYVVWGVIVICIITLLTILGYQYKSKLSPYKKAESRLVEYAEKYVDANFLYPEDGESIKVTLKDLQEDSKVRIPLVCDNAGDVTCEKCDGYVKVTKDGVYKYKAYIKCENYTTKGY